MSTETFYGYKYSTNADAVKARNERASELKKRGYHPTRSCLRNQVIKPSITESHFTNVYYVDY